MSIFSEQEKERLMRGLNSCLTRLLDSEIELKTFIYERSEFMTVQLSRGIHVLQRDVALYIVQEIIDKRDLSNHLLCQMVSDLAVLCWIKKER